MDSIEKKYERTKDELPREEKQFMEKVTTIERDMNDFIRTGAGQNIDPDYIKMVGGFSMDHFGESISEGKEKREKGESAFKDAIPLRSFIGDRPHKLVYLPPNLENVDPESALGKKYELAKKICAGEQIIDLGLSKIKSKKKAKKK